MTKPTGWKGRETSNLEKPDKSPENRLQPVVEAVRPKLEGVRILIIQMFFTPGEF